MSLFLLFLWFGLLLCNVRFTVKVVMAEVVAAALAQTLQQQLQSGRGVPTSAPRDGPGLPRSMKVGGRFVIDTELFPEWEPRTFGDFLRWRWGMRGKAAPMPPLDELQRALPVRRPDAAALAAPPTDGRLQATWLGHASVLVQFDGWSVLADPIFSERCSPVQWAGPKRVRPSPIQVDGLPRVDEAKFEKLQKYLKHNSRLVQTWGSPPKKIKMPTEGGRSLGFAFLEFETPVRPFLSLRRS